MGACMDYVCSGCGFEQPTLRALVEHEKGCAVFLRDQVESTNGELDRLRADNEELREQFREIRNEWESALERDASSRNLFREATDEIEELRKDVVWLSSRAPKVNRIGDSSWITFESNRAEPVLFDGTGSGLLAAVRRAREG